VKFLSLERIVGPGNSTDENFEILCLHLAKIAVDDPSAVHRNLPPDGGIDIYYEGSTSVAYQCKAYSQFRGDLVRAVENSAIKARNASVTAPFDVYALMIPFVPTRNQRQKLEEALMKSGSKTHIVDGDELEQRLFGAPQIATQFFPSVTIIMPPNCETLELITGHGKIINLHVQSVQTGQKIPLKVSSGASIQGVVNFLVALLRLPNTFVFNASSFYESGDLEWRLTVKRFGIKKRLSSVKTLEEVGVRNKDIVHLVFEKTVNFSGGFFKQIGIHREQISIDSDIYNEDEMNRALTKDERQGHFRGIRFKRLVGKYCQWHFDRVTHSMGINTKRGIRLTQHLRKLTK
jgi:hypothetical protein